LLGALFAPQWMAFFTTDPAVSAIGASYLLINGPLYVLLGAGAALFFASQGLGSVAWPFLAISSRLALLIAFGWLIKPAFDLGLRDVFIANAVSIAWSGLAIMLVFWLRSRRVRVVARMERSVIRATALTTSASASPRTAACSHP
jgi:Na+-driven multidrug efflux pump